MSIAKRDVSSESESTQSGAAGADGKAGVVKIAALPGLGVGGLHISDRRLRKYLLAFDAPMATSSDFSSTTIFSSYFASENGSAQDCSINTGGGFQIQ